MTVAGMALRNNDKDVVSPVVPRYCGGSRAEM